VRAVEILSVAWLYILRCADGSYYTGHTTNLERRMAEHQAGEGSAWTKSRLPVKLVFTQMLPDESQALVVEQQVKELVARQEGGSDCRELGAAA
jgi:predicted GIY-YIG superfamily endonuclease